MNTGCSSEGTTNNSSIKITNLLNKTEITEEPCFLNNQNARLQVSQICNLKTIIRGLADCFFYPFGRTHL